MSGSARSNCSRANVLVSSIKILRRGGVARPPRYIYDRAPESGSPAPPEEFPFMTRILATALALAVFAAPLTPFQAFANSSSNNNGNHHFNRYHQQAYDGTGPAE